MWQNGLVMYLKYEEYFIISGIFSIISLIRQTTSTMQNKVNNNTFFKYVEDKNDRESGESNAQPKLFLEILFFFLQKKKTANRF